MKKTTKKLLLALSLATVLGVGGTLAYFTDTDEASNMMTIGHVDGDLDEETDEPNVEKTDDGITYLDKIVPGDIISKRPFITLDANSETAYARVSITVVGDDNITDEQKAKLALVEDKLDINNAEGWYKGTDGYYYYNNVLNPGDKTPFIFTKVTIPGEEWDNSMADLNMYIKIKGEMIQSDNFNPVLTDGHISSWGSDITVKAYNE